MSRRGFLKRAALAGAAICVAPTLETVTAAERAIAGETSAATPAPASGMASISEKRTLGSGTAAMEVTAMGFGCMAVSYTHLTLPTIA